jgi:hypothetical protein
MSINKRVALLASAVAVAASPLAAGHGALKLGTSTTSLLVTEPQMQAQASEAPAWHAGDGSVYDSSQGRIIAAAPLSIASNTTVSPEYDTQPVAPSDTTRMDTVAPPSAIGSARGNVNRDRYRSVLK